MLSLLKPALIMLALFTVLTGLVYPLAVTGVAQGLMPKLANGSLLEVGGKSVGSALIGQPFDDGRYFWSRPSATGPFAYNAGASSGSNQGPLNPALKQAVSDRVAALHAADPDNQAPIPIDLVTASGSGLDPHISPAGARWQVGRVAKARGLPKEQLARLVEEHVEDRTLGMLGEPRVNVLRLNLALDALSPKDGPEPSAAQ